jgi:hypothetical protein
MADYDVRNTDPQFLARMMDLGPGGEHPWVPEELGQILEHQLSAPLEFDLLGLDDGVVSRLRSQCRADPPIETFRDLLHHPSPPIEFLELTKESAKTGRSHPDSPLPDEVASVLYLLSIVVAMAKCGRRITRLSDEGLRVGLGWALDQPWLDDSTRSLLEEGLKAVEAGQ